MLDGRYAIRLCILNHTTTQADVERAIEWFARSPEPSLTDESATIALSVEDRAPSVVDSLGATGAFSVEELAAIPLFSDLPPEQVARAAGWSREVRVTTGETVVERWDGARDFYVIIDGDAEVFVQDEYVRHLARGDFFGEVAALDWGSGFGYVRTATVVATSGLRLLALDPSHLGTLIRASAGFGEKLRVAARERLRQI
jgi:hypothetical protein